MLLQMAEFHSFLWLSNIPLCIYTYNIFSHSSVYGHLGCFRDLAVVNRAAMIIGVRYLFKLVFSFFPDIYPRVELLGHMVVLFLVY